MYRVSLDGVKSGMKVAKAIYTSDGKILINSGVTIRPRYIENLKRFGIASIYVEDNLATDVQIGDVVDESTRTVATKTVREFFLDKQQASAGRAVVTTADLEKVVNWLLDDLLSQKELIVNLSDIRGLDDYTFGHSVNVAVLSLITGIALGFSRIQLYHLGMGSLMHDVGKIKIPTGIMNKPGKLTPEETRIMNQHSQEGFRIMRQQNEISLLSAHIALEHHERYDGEGYPNRLRGDEIHLFSRICSVADVFDALTADRVYRKAFQPHEAYELLSGSGGAQFDYRVVKAFLHHIAAYPVGTWVELNTGEIGFVVETKPGFSTRPLVRLMLDPEKLPLSPPREIQLASEVDRLIIRVVPREEIEALQGRLPEVKKNLA